MFNKSLIYTQSSNNITNNYNNQNFNSAESNSVASYNNVELKIDQIGKEILPCLNKEEEKENHLSRKTSPLTGKKRSHSEISTSSPSLNAVKRFKPRKPAKRASLETVTNRSQSNTEVTTKMSETETKFISNLNAPHLVKDDLDSITVLKLSPSKLVVDGGIEPFESATDKAKKKLSLKRPHSRIADSENKQANELPKKKIKINTSLNKITTSSLIQTKAPSPKNEDQQILNPPSSKWFKQFILNLAIIENERELHCQNLFKTNVTSNPLSSQPTQDSFFVPTLDMVNPLPFSFNFLTVLTGGIVGFPLQIPSNETKKLSQNLTLAKEIILYVHKEIPFSSNYLSRSQVFKSYPGNPLLQNRETIISISNSLYFILSYVRSKTMKYEGVEGKRWDLEAFSKKFIKYKIGNCREMSVVGFNYAKNRATIEVFEFPKTQGDHAFLVIDRNQASNPSDYKNWGPDTVICDVWTGAFFPVAYIEQYLFDFKGVTLVNNILYTIVQPFNPHRQTLLLKQMT